ncbi:hypothetical protein M3Y97_00907700 [Aphelenchoides bicaudatus]|nr:hypothetical protein M3Y97_00907700 [Aphelenchoides bicaudatus]
MKAGYTQLAIFALLLMCVVGTLGQDYFDRIDRSPALDRSAMVRFGKRSPLDRSSMVRFGKRSPLSRSSMVRFGKRSQPLFDESELEVVSF